MGRRQAARSLTCLGEAAAPAVNCALLKSRSVEVQILLVEALAAIGKSLPQPRRTDIQLTLAVAQALTSSVEVVAAVARADQDVRLPADDSGRVSRTAPGEVSFWPADGRFPLAVRAERGRMPAVRRPTQWDLDRLGAPG